MAWKPERHNAPPVTRCKLNVAANPSMDLIHIAFMEGFIVDVSIANGASVHGPDIELWTPLHFATHTQEGEAVIDTLLAAGADVSALDI